MQFEEGKRRKRINAEQANQSEACETLIGMCDKSLLAPEEKETIAKIDKQRNLMDCDTGIDPCDRALLSAAEAGDVKKFDQQRNALACEAGEMSCDRSLLNAGKDKQNNGKPSS